VPDPIVDVLLPRALGPFEGFIGALSDVITPLTRGEAADPAR